MTSGAPRGGFAILSHAYRGTRYVGALCLIRRPSEYNQHNEQRLYNNPQGDKDRFIENLRAQLQLELQMTVTIAPEKTYL